MTAEIYDDLKQYVGSKDDFIDDLLNMGYTKGIRDEKNKVFEVLKQCTFEIPYENSAFGYGMKVIDYSKVMKMLKE